MNSTNANLASWMQLGPAAAILCWMTLKHQFGDAEMRLLECMSITWMHNKQFSEAQLSLKKEHWWGSVTQFCTKTMFFTLGFLGAHAPKLLVQQLVRRTAGLCKWSLGAVRESQLYWSRLYTDIELLSLYHSGGNKSENICKVWGKKKKTKSNELQLQKGVGRGWWKCGNSCLCHHYRLVSPPCIWIIWTFRFCFSSHCSRASVLFRLIHGFGHKDNINNNRNNRCVFICTLSQTIVFPIHTAACILTQSLKAMSSEKRFSMDPHLSFSLFSPWNIVAFIF